MNIILLTDSVAFAGTEQHMVTLSVALQNLGHVVYVGCPNRSPLSKKCSDNSVRTVALEMNGWVGVRAVLGLLSFVRANKIDTVHAHNGRSAMTARMTKLLYPSLNVVFTQHFILPASATRSGLSKLIGNIVHLFIASGVDHVVCISQAVEKALVSRGGPYIKCTRSIVLNGINIEASQTMSKDESDQLREDLEIPSVSKVILSASRLEPEKSVDLIVRSMTKLMESDDSIILVIAGTGTEEQNLKHLATRLKVASNIRFVGFRDDMARFISMADVLVLAAPSEPFGLTLLEAMSLGTTVVAAKSGGPQEIIDDRQTGFLFTPFERDSLIEAICMGLGNDGIPEIIETAKQKVTSKFSANRMAVEVSDVYSRWTKPEVRR